MDNLDMLLRTVAVFCCFSFVASAVYILNDYYDREEDKIHPTKRFRPLAAGKISIKKAFIIMSLLLFLGFLGMYLLSLNLFLILLCYYIMNLFYIFKLKQIPIIDFLIIALGFVIRVLIGSEANSIFVSNWIIIMTFLLATFLAVSKRRDDVYQFEFNNRKHRKVIENYNVLFMDHVISVIASILIVTYLLYITSTHVIEIYHTDKLYITAVFVLLGILRYLQIVFVDKTSHSPTKMLYRDRFLQVVILLWVLSFGIIIYWKGI